MNVVQNILNLSKQHKITNQELCKILNTNPNKIYDWKIGKSKPSAEDIMTLAKYFNVSSDYILGLANENFDSPVKLEEPEDENTVKERNFMQNKQTSDIIKNFCKKRNISITQLLNSCNLTKSFIYDLERRNTCPSTDKLERIADYFDCSIDYLIGRTDVPEVNRGEEDEYVLIASRSPGNNIPVQKIKLTKEMKELLINGENSDNEDL